MCTFHVYILMNSSKRMYPHDPLTSLKILNIPITSQKVLVFMSVCVLRPLNVRCILNIDHI